MSLEKKRTFIEKAYEILVNEGPEGIKIRRLAKELNCTSTVIYRYFDNLEHLTALASIRLLRDYISDFRSLVSNPQILSDPYGLNVKMWECLAKYAFENAPIYENLFFGKYQYSLGEVIFEYYQLFIDTSTQQDFDGYSTSILFNDDLYQRDLVLLRRAAALGMISIKDAEYLSEIECQLFRGMLLKYSDTYKEEGVAKKAADEFIAIIKNLEEKYRKKS